MSERTRTAKLRTIERLRANIVRLMSVTNNDRAPHEEEVILDTYIEMYQSVEEVLLRIQERIKK